MMKDDRAREIAVGMSKKKGEHWESLRVERQIYWYCKAEFVLKALETAGYEAIKKTNIQHRTSNIE